MVCSIAFALVVLSTLRFFFFNDPATTEIYTLSLHDALPIFTVAAAEAAIGLAILVAYYRNRGSIAVVSEDRKSTRLNSSHLGISYAVFCLKKKKKKKNTAAALNIQRIKETKNKYTRTLHPTV